MTSDLNRAAVAQHARVKSRLLGRGPRDRRAGALQVGVNRGSDGPGASDVGRAAGRAWGPARRAIGSDDWRATYAADLGDDQLGDYDGVPRFSWDGKLLAYSHGNVTQSDIAVLDIAEGTQTRLTEFGEEQGCHVLPGSFSPDGELLSVFCLIGDDNSVYYPAISAVVSVGDGDVTIFRDPNADPDFIVLAGGFGGDGELYAQVWSDDGQDGVDTFNRLDLDNPDTPGEELFSFGGDPRVALSGQFSGQSNRALFSRFHPADANDVELALVDFDADDYDSILDAEAAADIMYSLAFHPDEDSALIARGSAATGVGDLRLIDVDDYENEQTVLADDTVLEHGSLSGQISPDGQLVIFGDSDGDQGTWSVGSIYVVDIDGENLEKISTPDEASSPAFNPAAFE